MVVFWNVFPRKSCKKVRPWRPAPWNDPASLLRVNLQDEWAPVRFRGRFFPLRHESFLWLLWLMVTSPHLAIFSLSQFCEKCGALGLKYPPQSLLAISPWQTDVEGEVPSPEFGSQELNMQQTWVLTWAIKSKKHIPRQYSWLVLTFKIHMFIEVKLITTILKLECSATFWSGGDSLFVHQNLNICYQLT